MALAFAVGVMNLVWMAFLTVALCLENIATRGASWSRLFGVYTLWKLLQRNSGTVRITAAEIPALAEHLQMTEEAFQSVYTQRIGDDDEKSNHECIFHDKLKGCAVYQYRPRQFRTWPFLRSVVESPACWTKEATDYPGINRSALHNRTTIDETMLNDGTFGKM